MKRSAAAAATPRAQPDVLTLAIDVGGTRLKAGVLDPAGRMIIGPVRTETPHPGGPAAVVAALEQIVSGIGDYQRISIGFPGVTRRGHVLTAPNLGNEAWKDYPLVAELSRRLGRPARVLNDATVQGLGVIAGIGLELVITLGTGFGYSLFHEGRIAPHVEMGQHIARNRKTYDQYIGNAAFEEAGHKKWNRRLAKVIAAMQVLTTYDTLLIGGGNAKHIAFELPPHVRVIDNAAGITGGVKLWDDRYDELFEKDDA